MKRILPSPLLSAALFGLWLLLNDTVSPGHLLMAGVLAIGMPLLSASLRPQQANVGNARLLPRLILRVGRDVIVSAIEVARDIVRAPWHAPHSAFVRIPLELRDSHALASLAIITTVVPGTVWAELAPDRSWVLLHVWNLDDEASFIARYKSRYEHPLMEIFG
jgi:multicomponent K+:H+ antiporter subunit E